MQAMAANGNEISSDKTTVQKSEWISLNEAVEQWLGLVQFPSPQETLSPELARLLNSSFSEALRVPEFSIRGVQLDGIANTPKGPLVEIPSIHFRQYRTFRPQLNVIEPYHEDHPKDIAVEALTKSPRHPEWVDVQIHQASFGAWLRFWFRNHLFDEIAHGNMLPIETEVRLAELGFEPLDKKPNVDDFHPEKEVYWSILMAAAWISWRDMKAVTRNWESYTQHCRFWRSSRGPNQINEGMVLESSGRPTLLGLMIEESVGISKPNFPQPSMTINAARNDLWSKLQAGDLIAVGKQGFGERVPITAHLWLDLSIQGDGIKRETLGQPGGSSRSTAWSDVKVKRADVMRIWPNENALNTLGQDTIKDELLAELSPVNSTAKALRRIITKHPDDKKIIVGVLEELSADVAEENGITNLIRKCAINLGMFPADVDEQEKLVDRVRRNIRKQQRQ